MSYCRFSEGDVYAFPDVHGGITCCGCKLSDGASPNFKTPQEMIKHLDEHIAAGHDFPDEVLDRLEREIEEAKPLIEVLAEATPEPWIVDDNDHGYICRDQSFDPEDETDTREGVAVVWTGEKKRIASVSLSDKDARKANAYAIVRLRNSANTIIEALRATSIKLETLKGAIESEQYKYALDKCDDFHELETAMEELGLKR